MRFSKELKLKIISDFMNMSGSNTFDPAAFIDWLKDHPENAAYQAFYGQGDAYAAREWRIDQAREMASSLRIRVSYNDPQSKSVSVVEFPQFVSPMKNRVNGGGYEEMDINSPKAVDELKEEAKRALRAWLSRYAGAFVVSGIDLSAVRVIAE